MIAWDRQQSIVIVFREAGTGRSDYPDLPGMLVEVPESVGRE